MKTAKFLIGAFICLLSFFSLLMIAVHLIPHESIGRHCEESALTLQEEGLYPQPLGIPLFRIDTFTDALMLNMAFCADEKRPVESAMTNVFYTDDEMQVFERTQDILHGKKTANGFFEPYARYWHGHQTVLRPLLSIMGYKGIMRLNALCLWALALLSLTLVWRRLSLAISTLLLLSLMVVAFPVVPRCLQFSTCFHLTFLFIIALLLWPRLTKGSTTAASTFFVFGGLTSFFDILTTPLLTLGLPLVVCLLQHDRWQSVKNVISLSAVWALGYGVLWVSKCVLAQLLTGQAVVTDFLANVRVRSVAGILSMHELLVGQFGGTVALAICLLIAAGVVALVLFSHACWKRMQRNPKWGHHWWLLAVALIVPLWYVATLQHTVVHYWFTWRALAVSIFSISVFIYLTKKSAHEEDCSTDTLL